MTLSYTTLLYCWKKQIIRFKPDIEESQITESSIDLRMGTQATELIGNPGIKIRPVLSRPEGIFVNKKIKDFLAIPPRELILAFTMEKVTMPSNLCASVEGKSSLARFGLSVHITSPHIHPFFNANITLELYNHSKNTIEIYPGDKICQLIVSETSEPVPESMSSRGRYLNQKTPEPKLDKTSA